MVGSAQIAEGVWVITKATDTPPSNRHNSNNTPGHRRRSTLRGRGAWLCCCFSRSSASPRRCKGRSRHGHRPMPTLATTTTTTTTTLRARTRAACATSSSISSTPTTGPPSDNLPDAIIRARFPSAVTKPGNGCPPPPICLRFHTTTEDPARTGCQKGDGAEGVDHAEERKASDNRDPINHQHQRLDGVDHGSRPGDSVWRPAQLTKSGGHDDLANTTVEGSAASDVVPAQHRGHEPVKVS